MIAYPKIAGFILAFAAVASPATAGVLTGEVVAIADGDTLTVFDGKQQVRVRLAEIDAPERKQAFGTVSRQHLAKLCFRARARVWVRDVDRFGRVVGQVECRGIDANAAMVRAGLAWAFVRYVRNPKILALQQEARDLKRGLWRDAGAIPPWEFRGSAASGWQRQPQL